MNELHRRQLDALRKKSASQLAILEELEKNIEGNSTDYASRIMLANLCALFGMVDEAQATYRALVGERPDCALAYYHLGVACYRAGDLSSAIEHLSRARELDKTLSMSLYWLGLSYYHRGLTEEAEACYRELLKEEPKSSSMVLYHLAVIYVSEGRYEEAIHVLEKLVDIDGNNVTARYRLGRAYLKRARIPEAISTLKEALRLAPNDLPCRDLLDRILNTGDP